MNGEFDHPSRDRLAALAASAEAGKWAKRFARGSVVGAIAIAGWELSQGESPSKVVGETLIGAAASAAAAAAIVGAVAGAPVWLTVGGSVVVGGLVAWGAGAAYEHLVPQSTREKIERRAPGCLGRHWRKSVGQGFRVSPHVGPHTRRDSTRAGAIVFGALGAAASVGAVLAYRAGAISLAFVFCSLGLGLVLYAASQVAVLAERRRFTEAAAVTAGRIKSSAWPRRGLLAASTAMVLGGVAGLMIVGLGRGGAQLLVPLLLGAVGLVDTVRTPMERPSLTLEPRCLRLDTARSWVEIDWPELTRAAADGRGATLLLWLRGEREPVAFPAGELTAHPADIAGLLQQLVSDPAQRARLRN